MSWESTTLWSGHWQSPWGGLWSETGGCNLTLYESETGEIHIEPFVGVAPKTGDIFKAGLLLGNRAPVTEVFTPNGAIDPLWALKEDRYKAEDTCIIVPAGFALAIDENGDFAKDESGEYSLWPI